jgi:hypothetical protein
VQSLIYSNREAVDRDTRYLTIWVFGVRLPCQIEEPFVVANVFQQNHIYSVQGKVPEMLALLYQILRYKYQTKVAVKIAFCK